MLKNILIAAIKYATLVALGVALVYAGILPPPTLL